MTNNFGSLHKNTQRRIVEQQLNYVVVDGKPYDVATGEYIGDKFKHELKVILSEKQRYGIQSRELLGDHEKENGGFVFAFFTQTKKMSARFPTLNNADIARLMFLATYIAWDSGRLQYDNGREVSREGLGNLLLLTRQSAAALYKRYCELNILEQREDGVYMDRSIFYRGELRNAPIETQDMQYVRLFKKTVRDIYNKARGRAVGNLALIYAVLPFLNFETNIVCFNPNETNLKRLIPISVEQLAEMLGYSDYRSLKRALNNVRVGKAPMFGFFDNPEDRREKRITVNPNIVFAGNGDHLKAIMTQFNAGSKTK